MNFYINTKKNLFAMTLTKILNQNSDFDYKKKIEKNRNIHNFCILKESNSEKLIIRNWKKKRMINKSWRKNENSLNIITITTVSFDVLIKQKNVKIFAIFLKNVNYEMRKKSLNRFKKIILKKYYNFLNVFFKQEADKFSFHKNMIISLNWWKKKEISTKPL